MTDLSDRIYYDEDPSGAYRWYALLGSGISIGPFASEAAAAQRLKGLLKAHGSLETAAKVIAAERDRNGNGKIP